MTKKILLSIALILLFCSSVFADGTKQVMPDSNNGVAMYITDDGRYGPYLNAPVSQRLQFRILDHTTENLYFGVNPRERTGSPLALSTNLYYQIKNASGNVVAGPFNFNTSGAGYIDTYNQAVAGPNVGGAVPAGYTPLSFNPTANGDYYIEIYKSNDSGATRTTSGADIALPYFDFTVSDTSNNRSEGRVFSQKWGFITYNPTNFVPSISFDFKGKFFGYTDDQIVVTVEFQEGFRPFGYLLAMNKFGVVDDDNDPANVWTTTRKSISYNGSTGNTIPELLNGYPVFITQPDPAAFPTGVQVAPVAVGQIFGCPGNYLIPVKTLASGDVDIVMNLNGVDGFQKNTKDIIIHAFNQPAGNIVIPWNGLDGLGNPVLGNTTSSATLTSLRGRTSVPMIDAELNPNGLIINSIVPVLANRKMFWDDSGVTQTPNNGTVGGLDVSASEDGLLGPTHKWNGNNPPGDNTPNMPAPAGSVGSATTTTTDDFGNERVLNTWFYGEQVESPISAIVVPDCDIDNDGISDNADLDDDNDGILDTVELGSFDPDGDHDADGVPDYIDPQFPGFVDTNSDGVDDRFDLDLDGIMNHWDLDSDGDGIPDTVEAQTTTGYTAPSTSVNGSGVPTNFASGITPVNTDGDANADYLDTDSDGDSLTDTAEAGITLTNTDTDNDGLDNATDATNGPLDKDGTINNPSALPDTDNDVNAGGDVDYRDKTDNDIDKDGLSDAVDLDDDNDGILDTVENNCTTTAISSSGPVIDESGTTGDLTLINDGDLTADEGLALNVVGEYIVIDLGSELRADIKLRFTLWANTSTSSRAIRIAQLPNSTTNIGGGTNPKTVSLADISNGGNVKNYEYTLTQNTRYIQIDMTVRTGGRIEVIEAQILPYETCVDTDSDGIIDRLDLDSDGDGCSDALESGATTNQSPNYQFPSSPVGTDGVPDAVQTTSGANSGSVDYTVSNNYKNSAITACNCPLASGTDTDGDGIDNICDLDDDNDGILDTVECPTTNASLTGTAGASSILAGYPASNLNDNNPNTFVHTSIAASASSKGFIEIDLGQAKIINQIEIINRASPAGDRNRLANVYVLIADTPFPTDPDNLAGSLANADFTFQLASNETGDPVIPVPSVVGRYVRMQLSGNNVNTTGTPGQGILNIAELRAFNLQDTDGDLIPDCLDTDSDNDGCPDASEGANKITTGLVDLVGGSTAPGSIKNLGTTVTTTAGSSLGVPTATGSPQGTTSGVRTAVQLTVPTITSPQSVNVGDNITLDASAAAAASATSYTTGTPVYGTPGNANAGLRYEWQFNSGSGYTTVQAASTTANYTVTSATTTNSGMYKVIITHIDNNCISEEVIVDLNVVDPCADGASTNGMPTASDSDGDGINNVCDVDDDNDGILDSVEIRCNQPAEANSTSGTGSLQNQLYFFNWDDAAFANGLQVGDTQTFNLPSGLQIVATVKSVSGSGSATYVPTDMQTWPEGDFGKAYNTAGTKEAFYGSAGAAIDVTMTFVGTKNGMPYPLDLLAFDPESTGNNEQIIFTTNGGNWGFVETIHTQTSTGANGTYVVSGQTLTANETYQTGSSLYVSNRATELRIQSNGLSGTQAIAFGVFLRCDTDNDGIPNSADTDSDNDGCPDAIEAAGNIQSSQLTALTGGSTGGSSNNLGATSDAEGNPIVSSTGFEQLSTAAVLDANDKDACLIDLSVTKTIDKAVPKKGQTVIFTLQLKNTGAADAINVRVKDLLPAGLTYNAASSVIPINTTYTAATGIWDLSVLTITKNQTIELKIAATVTTVGTIVTNKTEVFSTTETDKDSTPNNNN